MDITAVGETETETETAVGAANAALEANCNLISAYQLGNGGGVRMCWLLGSTF